MTISRSCDRDSIKKRKENPLCIVFLLLVKFVRSSYDTRCTYTRKQMHRRGLNDKEAKANWNRKRERERWGGRKKTGKERVSNMETVLVKGRGEGRELAGLDEKGPNLFSGRPSTPSPAKRPTTVWPSSYNPYYTKRTERPPPPSEERVERPEQKLRGGQSTGEACILSSGPPSPALSFTFFTIVLLLFWLYYSLCVLLLSSSIFHASHANARANLTRISLLSLLAIGPRREPLFVTRYSALTYTALDRIVTHRGGRRNRLSRVGSQASQPFCRGWDVVVCCLVLVCGIDKLWVEWKNSRLFVPRYARGRILLREDRWNRGISRAKGLVARNVWHSIFDETLPSLWNWYSEIRSSFFLSFFLVSLAPSTWLEFKEK